MPALTIKAYAERIGRSRQAVEKAIREGRLSASIVSRSPVTMIDAYHADQEWAATTRPIAGGVASSAREPVVLAPPGQRPRARGDGVAGPAQRRARHLSSGDDDDGQADDGPDLYLEKALKARADRQLAELNLAKAERAVVPLDAARRLWFGHWRGLRDRLLAIPEREAAGLSAESDPAACALILDTAIRAAFGTMPAEAPAPELDV